MALQDHYVSLTFQQGLDTETNEKTVPVGKLTTLQNGVFTQDVTIAKRFGTDLIPTTRIGPTFSQVSGAFGLASRLAETELDMLASTDEVLSYDASLNGWVKKGNWVPLQLSVTELPHRPQECWDFTTASTGSVRIVAWQDSRKGIRGQLLNATTGAPYSSDFQIDNPLSPVFVTGSQPKARVVGGQFHVYFVTSNSLYVATIPPTTPTAPSATLTQLDSNIATPTSGALGGAPCPYDVRAAGGNAYIAWLEASGSNGPSMPAVKFAGVTPNGNLGLTTTSPSFPNPVTLTGSQMGVATTASFGPVLAISPDGVQASVVWGASASFGTHISYQSFNLSTFALTGTRIEVDKDPAITNGYCRRLTAAYSPVDTTPYILQVCAEVSGNLTQPVTAIFGGVNGVVCSAATASIQSNAVRTVRIAADGASNRTGSLQVKYNSQLGSEAFSLGGTVGRNFVWMTQQAPLQSTDYLVRLDDMMDVARSRPGLCVTDVSGAMSTVDLSADGNTAYRAATQREIIPFTTNATLTAASGAMYLGRDGVINNTAYHVSSSWQPTDVDGVLVMPGGWLGSYDGVQVTELGFGMQVEGLVVSPGSGTIASQYGVGMMLSGTTLAINGTGTYSYAVIPEWFDARGNRHLGSCAYVAIVTLTGTNVAGQNGAQGFFQNSASLAWPSIPHTMKDGVNAPLCNFAVYRTGPGQNVYQRVDDPRYPIINSTGSSFITFSDQIPESIRAQGEVWYQTAQNANVMQPAPTMVAQAGDRLYLAGLEAEPHFVAASQVRAGGAIAFANGAGVVVDARGGPITALATLDDNVIPFKESRIFSFPDSGPSNLLADGTPWPLPAFVTSDVGVPAGSFAANVAGQTVQGLMFRSLRGFRLLDRGQVVHNIGAEVKRFDGLVLTAGVAPKGQDEARFYTANGTTLVLNTRFTQWGTFTDQRAVGACIWNGRPVYAMNDGRCFAEDTGSFTDAGTPYQLVIETGHIPLQGLQGLSRVRSLQVLGDYYSDHTFAVDMAFDYNNSYVFSRQVATSASLLLTTYGNNSGGYGTGSFGSQDPVYQHRFDMPVQRMQALRLRFYDLNQTGQDFSLTEVKIRAAFEKGSGRFRGPKIV